MIFYALLNAAYRVSIHGTGAKLEGVFHPRPGSVKKHSKFEHFGALVAYFCRYKAWVLFRVFK